MLGGIVSRIMLTLLLIGMINMAFKIAPVAAEGPLIRDLTVSISPKFPIQGHDEVNVTVSFWILEAKHSVDFGNLTQNGNTFQVDVNVSMIGLEIIGPWVYNHTYHVGKLSRGSYQFSAYVYLSEMRTQLASATELFIVSVLVPWVEIEPELSAAQGFCDEFSINLYILNVIEDHRLIGIEWKLLYDATLLEVTSCVEGDFFRKWADFANRGGTEYPYNTHFECVVENGVVLGFILYYMYPWCAWCPWIFPEGSGTLVTITFHVIYQPPYKVLSKFVLEHILAVDVDGNVVPFDVKHGRYMCPVRAEDLNIDGRIDIGDIFIFAMSFGSYPGHPRWVPRADIDRNGVINIIDGTMIAKSFGSSDS